MADKQIIIAGKRLMYGTSVKCSPEVQTSSTNTFDGAITQGLDNVSWNIEISRVRYDAKVTHQQLSQLIEEMFSTPHNVTIRETVKPSGQDAYTIVDTYYGCIVDGNDYILFDTGYSDNRTDLEQGKKYEPNNRRIYRII